MSFRNYTPAAWPGNVGDVWDGRFVDNLGSNQTANGATHSTFQDHLGRRCHIVCDPPKNFPPQQNLRRIANLIIGKTIRQAQRIYPNIRVVIRDGQQLITTQDFQVNRINVETMNDIIIRVLGFY
jgi:hypothetical protein